MERISSGFFLSPPDGVFQVPPFGDLPELLVRPGHDPDPVRLVLREVVLQLPADLGPQDGRDPAHLRQVVLEHLLQGLVVEAQDVLELGLGQAALGGGDVAMK